MVLSDPIVSPMAIGIGFYLLSRYPRLCGFLNRGPVLGDLSEDLPPLLGISTAVAGPVIYDSAAVNGDLGRRLKDAKTS